MAGYGFMNNNRGNFFNTYKAMERHMHDGNSISAGARPSSYAHSYPPAGESFLSMKKDNYVGGGEHPMASNNIIEQDLFEKVRINRMQVTQLNRRRNWSVKPSTGNNIYQHNNGKYAAQGAAQSLRFGAPAGDVSAK